MTRIHATLLIFLLMTACGVEPGDPIVGDDDGAGGEMGTDPDAGGTGGAGTLPTYPKQPPRIFLGPNRARLQSNLAASTPAATRFRNVVTQWFNGASIWGFGAWNGALYSQLTGNAAYCTKSVAEVEAQVAAAEAAIAGGQK